MSKSEMFGFPVYPPAKKCTSCNGECCKRLPGIYHPDQFESWEEIRGLILSAGACIDWWEDQKKGYFVRPRAKNAIRKVVDPSWGGECMHFRDGKGCVLPMEDRPLGCRAVEPGEVCRSSYDKEEAKDVWARWWKELDELAGSAPTDGLEALFQGIAHFSEQMGEGEKQR